MVCNVRARSRILYNRVCADDYGGLATLDVSTQMGMSVSLLPAEARKAFETMTQAGGVLTQVRCVERITICQAFSYR
jgi:hypothetical protein